MVDVGANVGMASFAAAVMGFRVVAFEPVFENLQRICDGVYLNRVQDRLVVYHAAASDRLGNITMHKVVHRSLVFISYLLVLMAVSSMEYYIITAYLLSEGIYSL